MPTLDPVKLGAALPILSVEEASADPILAATTAPRRRQERLPLDAVDLAVEVAEVAGRSRDDQERRAHEDDGRAADPASPASAAPPGALGLVAGGLVEEVVDHARSLGGRTEGDLMVGRFGG